MAITLSSRTIKHLEGEGYNAANVEKYNCYSKRSSDLFGVFDILAVGNGETVAVQVTSRSNIAARVKKMTAAEDIMAACREAGWRILVHGWDKYKGQYRLKVVDLS